MTDPTHRCQVLIVEDEYFIAEDLARMLRKAGLHALRPAASARAALGLIETAQVDFAVVDINLDGVISFAVAAALRARGIPFLFLTGYEAAVVPAEFGDVVRLQKPNDMALVVAEIGRHVAACATPPLAAPPPAAGRPAS